MSDTAPRVPWTAIITTAVIVLGVLITLGSGLISVGTNTAQISINTAELIRIRGELAKIEELGTPGLQELKKRVEALEGTHAALPAEDAKISGRIENVVKDVSRLDSVTVKKTDEYPVIMQRIATLEAKLDGVLARAINLRQDFKDHQEDDAKHDAARIKMLEDTLLTERNKQVRAGGGP